MTALDQGQAFDTAAFELPIPRLDGQRADRVILSFGGSLELDRTSEEDLALIDSMLLGRDVKLTISANVAGKGFSCQVRDDGDTTGYRVQLRVHSITE